MHSSTLHIPTYRLGVLLHKKSEFPSESVGSVCYWCEALCQRSCRFFPMVASQVLNLKCGDIGVGSFFSLLNVDLNKIVGSGLNFRTEFRSRYSQVAALKSSSYSEAWNLNLITTTIHVFLYRFKLITVDYKKYTYRILCFCVQG